MAPTPPQPSITGRKRTKLPKSVRPPSQSICTRPDATSRPSTSQLHSNHDRSSSTQSSLSSNKRDKRQIKHSLLLSRLKRANTGSRIQKKRASLRENKRRRTNLTSKLSDLRDVLPADDATGRPARAGSSVKGQGGLKTRPGHTKRLSRLKEAEMDRFKKNMAAMGEGSREGAPGTHKIDKTNTDADAQVSEQQSARWAALRAHITSQQT